MGKIFYLELRTEWEKQIKKSLYRIFADIDQKDIENYD